MDKNMPAFPAHDYVVGDLKIDGFKKLGCTRGMTLRDYFAGQFIMGNATHSVGPDETLETYLSKSAIMAYKIADAMLAEREK